MNLNKRQEPVVLSIFEEWPQPQVILLQSFLKTQQLVYSTQLRLCLSLRGSRVTGLAGKRHTPDPEALPE